MRFKDEDLGEYKIPFISHIVWVTNPKNPKELVEYYPEHVIESLLKTYDALDRSYEGKWDHYLWTNYLELIPKTAERFRKRGLIVKDIRELDNVTPEVWEVYKHLETRNKKGA